MVAQLRRKGDPPPVQSTVGDVFTLEVHHGGFFMGSGNLKSYVDEKIDWFDGIETNTWSPVWFGDFAQKLGYMENTNLRIQWLLPGKTIADGLRIIVSDHDTNVMSSVVKKFSTLVCYFDYDDTIGGADWDDVVTNPVRDLPKVISPMKVPESKFMNSGQKLPVFFTNLDNDKVEQLIEVEDMGPEAGNDTESDDDDFVDSDNDIQVGDEDLLEDNVETNVGRVKGNKKAKGSKLKAIQTIVAQTCYDDEEIDDEGLELPDSDGEGEGRLRFSSFREEDLNNPTLSMFERIKTQIMTRHYNKQKELESELSGAFCPKIRKKVAKNAEWTNMCYALPSGQGVFQVQVRDYQHIVDIAAQKCDCRRWQLTGIPCSHAIACLRHERIPPESVLPTCYSVDTFKRAYASNIWPCKDKSQWESVEGTEVLPPSYEKKIGRPPKSRKKHPEEIQGKHGPKLSKHGVSIHCSHCSEGGHNSAGCKLKKMGFNSEDAKKLVANTRAQLQQEAEQSAMAAAASHTGFEQAATEQGAQDLRHEDVIQTTQASSTMMTVMMEEETQQSKLSQPQGPLPECGFILSNIPVPRSVPLTTNTKAGKAAASRKRSSSTTSSKPGRAASAKENKKTKVASEEAT